MTRAVPSERSVVLLTTWDRPSLLRQSLPRIEAEASRVGARIVISDDRSTDPETLELVAGARDRGADLIRPALRGPDLRVAGIVHADPREARRRLIATPEVSTVIARCAATGVNSGEVGKVVRRLWKRSLAAAFQSAQVNNLFGLRHILATYPDVDWIFKVDDDVVCDDGAFAMMLDTWGRAEGDGVDVWSVSGMRTPHERLRELRSGYGITLGACNVAILYRAEDWRRFLQVIPEQLVVEKGFDLAFAWDYAPRHRPSAVPVCLIPSAVYHTGRNGLNVRDADLNCDYPGETDALVVV